jgi:DNA processing protein
MTEPLSPNTRAILLLTAPLIVGRGKRSRDPLSPGEYKKLARRLRELEAQPADLLAPESAPLRAQCGRVVETARLERLLARGFLLSQALERWQARAIWVLSRADAAYPRRLKDRLKQDSPPLLYGGGNRELLESGGLAVVGSRKVDDAQLEYTLGIGRLAASAGRTLISGGARGVDQAAMRGALEAGGRAAGVLADSMELAATNRENREVLIDGRLVLVSPYDPGASFNVGHAMQRNKVIYALADAALIVNAEVGKGGTWAGATEQLAGRFPMPVYVRSTGERSGGLQALREKGARPWPNPEDAAGLEAALAAWPAASGAAVGDGSFGELAQASLFGTFERRRSPASGER